MSSCSDFMLSDTHHSFFFALDPLSPSREDKSLYTCSDCSHQEGKWQNIRTLIQLGMCSFRCLSRVYK